MSMASIPQIPGLSGGEQGFASKYNRKERAVQKERSEISTDSKDSQNHFTVSLQIFIGFLTIPPSA